jgi:hypothetical protein
MNDHQRISERTSIPFVSFLRVLPFPLPLFIANKGTKEMRRIKAAMGSRQMAFSKELFGEGNMQTQFYVPASSCCVFWVLECHVD